MMHLPEPDPQTPAYYRTQEARHLLLESQGKLRWGSQDFVFDDLNWLLMNLSQASAEELGDLHRYLRKSMSNGRKTIGTTLGFDPDVVTGLRGVLENIPTTLRHFVLPEPLSEREFQLFGFSFVRTLVKPDGSKLAMRMRNRLPYPFHSHFELPSIAFNLWGAGRGVVPSLCRLGREAMFCHDVTEEGLRIGWQKGRRKPTPIAETLQSTYGDIFAISEDPYALSLLLAAHTPLEIGSLMSFLEENEPEKLAEIKAELKAIYHDPAGDNPFTIEDSLNGWMLYGSYAAKLIWFARKLNGLADDGVSVSEELEWLCKVPITDKIADVRTLSRYPDNIYRTEPGKVYHKVDSYLQRVWMILDAIDGASNGGNLSEGTIGEIDLGVRKITEVTQRSLLGVNRYLEEHDFRAVDSDRSALVYHKRLRPILDKIFEMFEPFFDDNFGKLVDDFAQDRKNKKGERPH